MKEKTKEKFLDTKSMILCALFAALIAAGAFIKIPVPMVPFTLQFLFTNMAGLLLGRKHGLIAVLVYIIVGIAGVPVFTQGGGPAYVLQPTFGYIIGMAIGTWLCGYLVERWGDGFKSCLLAGFINLVVVYIIGMTYLYFIKDLYLGTPISFKNLIIYCCLVFIPGDGLSCVIGAFLTKRLRPVIRGKNKAS